MKRFDSVSTAGGGKLSYPRLMITPLGVLPLLLSVVAALASGFLMLFSPASETASSLAIIDIAAACAFIALFGYLFGIWVGTKAALMVTQALLYMTDVSGRRLDKLAGKLAREVEEPRCELSEVAETSDSSRSSLAGYLVAAGILGYFLGFIGSISHLSIVALHLYTFADTPPAITHDLYILSLYAFLAVLALALCLVSSIIALQWWRIRTLETKFASITYQKRMYKIAPINMEISASISKARARVLRFAAS